MKAKDPLKVPPPKVTGFHKRNIAAAAVIAVVAVAAIVFILTGGEDTPIVRTEPRIPPQPELPPAALLEEPPPPPAPPTLRFEPPPARSVPASTTPPGPPRLYQEALKSPIAPAGARPQRPDRVPEGRTVEFLDTALRDLERQQARLQNLQGSFSSFPGGLSTPLGAARPGGGTSRDPEVRFTAGAPAFRIDQGTVLEAQLLTAIDSNLPGQILGQVSHDVFDSRTLRSLLIPKGSRLLGRYDPNLALGQNRILVTWDRILLPDGSSLEMPEQPGVDSQGRAGLRDRVNHHLGRIFGQAALLSLIGAGFELAQPADTERTRSRLALTGATRELEVAASELLRSRSSIPPTIRIRAGLRFHVLLNRDLVFERPYRR